jgi:peptide/nickel transport system ATP-binding protein
MSHTLLLIKDLKKYFPVRTGMFSREKKCVHAVDGISFAVKKGRTLGIVGESGCGKSTTARLIANLMPADSGSIIFDGEGVGEFGGLALKTFRKKLQMVFQDSFASLNPRLTITETISYGPMVHGTPKEEAHRQAHTLLARVGLDPALFASRYPHELSGGQRQRVNIARALAFNPEVVILDEAVAALDKSVQAQVLNLLQELKAEFQLTYLFISHDLHVVHYMSDDVMVMYLGQIVEMGPVERVYGEAAHPYTQALFSAVPSMDPAQRTLQSPITGDPPNPIHPPSGCRFHDRCEQARAICSNKVPALMPVQGDHWVACHMNHASSGYETSDPVVHPTATGEAA